MWGIAIMKFIDYCNHNAIHINKPHSIGAAALEKTTVTIFLRLTDMIIL